MAYKALATKYYVKKEAVFNQGAVFDDNDLVEVTDDSSLKPEISTIERKIINCTYLNKPALAGKESGSGTLGFELIPVGNGSKDLTGGSVLEVCMGEKENPDLGSGAVIRSSAEHQVEETTTAGSNTGDGTLTFDGYNDDTVKTETWTLTVTDDSTAGSEVWSVSGSVSGDTDDATTGVAYDNGIIKFTITEGDTDFAKGDKFTLDVTSNVAWKIYEVTSTETGEAYLYKLGRPCGTEDSLTAQVLYGCDSTDSRALIMNGIVPESFELKIPTAEIATISFSVKATSFKTDEGLPVPACEVTDSAIPYVGKNAKFIVDNTTKEAKDVSLSVTNTVADIEAITTTGVAGKAITKKEVKGSFTVTFANWDELNKFKNNGFGALYIELNTEDTDGNPHRFAVYCPKISYTAVNVDNDNGILVNKIEFQGYIDPTLTEAILIAHQ